MMIEKAIAAGVLDKDVHDILIRDIEKYAKEANIPIDLICKPMKTFCNKQEIEWASAYRTDTHKNAIYLKSDNSISVDQRMSAVVAAFLRNYVDARLYTVQKVVAMLKQGQTPSCSVLMIPNFFINKDQGGHVASWEISSLLGMLIDRAAANKKTALYVDSMAACEDQYGEVFTKHFKNYTIIN